MTEKFILLNNTIFALTFLSLISWSVRIVHLFKAAIQISDFWVNLIPARDSKNLHNLRYLHEVVACNMADGDIRSNAIRFWITNGWTNKQCKYQVCTGSSHLENKAEIILTNDTCIQTDIKFLKRATVVLHHVFLIYILI